MLKSAKAQTVAKNVAGRFLKACKQVVDRKGAAADNSSSLVRCLDRFLHWKCTAGKRDQHCTRPCHTACVL